MSVAELQAQKTALLAQIATLERRVSNGDQMVEYDMAAAPSAMALLEAELTRQQKTAGVARTRSVVVTAVSGL